MWPCNDVTVSAKRKYGRMIPLRLPLRNSQSFDNELKQSRIRYPETQLAVEISRFSQYQKDAIFYCGLSFQCPSSNCNSIETKELIKLTNFNVLLPHQVVHNDTRKPFISFQAVKCTFETNFSSFYSFIIIYKN